MDSNARFHLSAVGENPVLATAIHAGHALRPEVAERSGLSDSERLREEDPFTDEFAAAAPNWIAAETSRFEVDLNRPRGKAVYRRPEDAWGLTVWKSPPPSSTLATSLAEYDQFHADVDRLLTDMIRRNGSVIVLDLHSYNHRRQGPNQPPDDPKGNPDVNVGTGTMLDRERWAAIIDGCLTRLRERPILDHRLDARENVKFKGGNFPAWLHRRFPGSVCCLSLEFKKIFMDEWTGKPNRHWIGAIKRLVSELAGELPGIES